MSEGFSLKYGSRVLVIGASGGIGSALVEALASICGAENVVGISRSHDGLDITDEASVAACAAGVNGPFSLILCATGALVIDGNEPEKSIKSVTAEQMQRQFETNALGPALLLKHFHGALDERAPSLFVVLTARVGSIGDNQLGGWLSYRVAKAAANQVLRTASIEIARRNKQAICLALHPGTVQTPLTQKYVANHPSVPPQTAAQNILCVLDGRTRVDNGSFLDWAGKHVEW